MVNDRSDVLQGMLDMMVLRALLLEPKHRPAGFALQSIYGSFSMMAGPAVAGLIIGTVGITSAYHALVS